MSYVLTINQPFVIAVLIVCLAIGYAIKHFSIFKKINNSYIPYILFIFGAICACVYTQSIGLDIILEGGAVGLLSTGSHQLIQQFFNLYNEKHPKLDNN